MKFKSLLGLAIALFFFAACKKQTIAEISTTDFNVKKNHCI
ncbi:hypothetical protein [Pedobacter kyungheensis]|nr:hypothetical protein [Pedobacter kyungheensis]